MNGVKKVVRSLRPVDLIKHIPYGVGLRTPNDIILLSS